MIAAAHGFDADERVGVAKAIGGGARFKVDGHTGPAANPGIAVIAHPVKAIAAIERVVTRKAHQGVVATIPNEQIVKARRAPGADVDQNVAVAARLGHGARRQVDGHGAGGVGIADLPAAFAAIDHVAAGAGDDEVKARAAKKRVIARAALQLILAIAAVEDIIAHTAEQRVRPFGAKKRVIAIAAVEFGALAADGEESVVFEGRAQRSRKHPAEIKGGVWRKGPLGDEVDANDACIQICQFFVGCREQEFRVRTVQNEDMVGLVDEEQHDGQGGATAQIQIDDEQKVILIAKRFTIEKRVEGRGAGGKCDLGDQGFNRCALGAEIR